MSLLSGSSEGQREQNPYASPDMTAPIVESSAIQSTEEGDLRAFVGRRADYYLEEWAPVRYGYGRSTGFNWAACLFSGLWLPYRKMYWEAAGLYGFIMLESLGEVLLENGGGYKIAEALGVVVGVSVAVVCGVFGNRWYWKCAKRAIADVCRRGLDRTEVRRVLAHRGRTTVLGVFLFLIGFLIVLAAAQFALISFSLSGTPLPNSLE